MTDTDILADLDAFEQHHADLCGGASALPGLDSNIVRVAMLLEPVRAVLENTVALKAEYDSGITHEQRVHRSMYGVDLPGSEADKQRIADLERQLAELRGGQ
jgi:hypothetical protein